MNSSTAIVLIAIGLCLTMMVGMASQRRGERGSRRVQSSPPPQGGPTAEQREDIDAVQEGIEAARNELRWLRDQVAKERERLERMRKQQPSPAQVPAPPSRPPATDSPWVILGLRPGSSPEDIRRRYRLLSRVWHPDRFTEGSPELRAEAEMMMARLNKAHNTLAGTAAGFRG